jgi:hypothetical protein
MRIPFQYFTSSPEVVRLAVMMYIKRGDHTLAAVIEHRAQDPTVVDGIRADHLVASTTDGMAKSDAKQVNTHSS